MQVPTYTRASKPHPVAPSAPSSVPGTPLTLQTCSSWLRPTPFGVLAASQPHMEPSGQGWKTLGPPGTLSRQLGPCELQLWAIRIRGRSQQEVPVTAMST